MEKSTRPSTGLPSESTSQLEQAERSTQPKPTAQLIPADHLKPTAHPIPAKRGARLPLSARLGSAASASFVPSYPKALAITCLAVGMTQACWWASGGDDGDPYTDSPDDPNYPNTGGFPSETGALPFPYQPIGAGAPSYDSEPTRSGTGGAAAGGAASGGAAAGGAAAGGAAAGTTSGGAGPLP